MDKDFLIIFNIFSIIQYLLCSTETLLGYSTIATDIQGYKFKFFHDEKGNFTFVRLSIYLFGYVIVSMFVYKYVILTKMKYLESFFFLSFIYLIWDACYVQSFNNVLSKVPLLAYDIFVTGGLAMVASIYLFNNYRTTLSLPILFILNALSISLFFYIQRLDELN